MQGEKLKAENSVIIMLFFNVVLGGIISLIAVIVGKSFMDGMGAIFIIFPVLFIPSLIVFSIFWNDIEKIYD
ncbi:MAG: hypothetical protein ACRCX8_03540 [Sarcina sp.]